MASASTLAPPELELLCDLSVEIGTPIEVGDMPRGQRRMIPIAGGSVRGPAFNGRVLPGGADVQLIVGEEVAILEARYVIELDDGARVFVHNRALRVAPAEVTARLLRGEAVPPQQVYFRCQPSFECAAPRWAWLMQRQFVGTGQRDPALVRMSFYQVL